jgi:hypothetical protein
MRSRDPIKIRHMNEVCQTPKSTINPINHSTQSTNLKASRITSILKTLLRSVASFVGQWRKKVSGRSTRFLGRAPAAVGVF